MNQIAPESEPVSILRIQPSKGWVGLGLKELWAYRELLYFLTWRDIKVRYKQTILGAAWALLQPLMAMLVFTLFFGKLAKIPSDGVPYPVFSFAALVPWTFFSSGMANASNSLVGGSSLLKKVFFPRLVMPIATVLSGLVDFCLAFLLLLVLMGIYGLTPTINVLWLPLLLIISFLTATGVGLWLAAMNVQFRDVRYTVPFLTQFWMFATPIAYPSSLIENELLRTIYGLNPMTGVIEGIRWGLLGTETAPGSMILVSGATALAICVSGLFYFRRMERSFADIA